MTYDLKNLQMIAGTALPDELRPEVVQIVPGQSAPTAQLTFLRPYADSPWELAYEVRNDEQYSAAQFAAEKGRDPKAKVRDAHAKVVRLRREVTAVTTRIKYLDAKHQVIVSQGDIRTDFNRMMEQLEQLLKETRKDPEKFELIVSRKYDGIMETINTIKRKVNALESPTPKK